MSREVQWNIYHDNKNTNNPHRIKLSELHMVTKNLETDKEIHFTTSINLINLLLLWHLKLRLLYEKNNKVFLSMAFLNCIVNIV